MCKQDVTIKNMFIKQVAVNNKFRYFVVEIILKGKCADTPQAQYTISEEIIILLNHQLIWVPPAVSFYQFKILKKPSSQHCF